MRRIPLVILLVLGLFAAVAPAAPASSGPAEPDVQHCSANPPCGPIPVDLLILLEKSRRITFTDGKFETTGKLVYSFDIDQDGVLFSPDKEVKAHFTTGRIPPWTTGAITPAEITIPINPTACPPGANPSVPPKITGCYLVESQDQVEYHFEATIFAKVEKIREPTYEELKRWVRSDGTYRFFFEVRTDSNMVGTSQTGEPAGLDIGYVNKELRFIPDWSAAAKTSQGSEPEAEAPAGGLFAGLASVVVAAAAWRRRN